MGSVAWGLWVSVLVLSIWDARLVLLFRSPSLPCWDLLHARVGAGRSQRCPLESFIGSIRSFPDSFPILLSDPANPFWIPKLTCLVLGIPREDSLPESSPITLLLGQRARVPPMGLIPLEIANQATGSAYVLSCGRDQFAFKFAIRPGRRIRNARVGIKAMTRVGVLIEIV